MACGLPGNPIVKSGIRSSSNVYIWVDIRSAMDDGIVFFRTENGVICTPNIIDKKYFSRVINNLNGKKLQY